MSEALRRRLAALARARRTTRTPEASAAEPCEGALDRSAVQSLAPAASQQLDLAASQPLNLADMLPGRTVATVRGPIFVHARESLAQRASAHLETRIARAAHEATGTLWLFDPEELEPGALALRRHGLERALFLDLETGGLAGQPIFLAGLLRVEGRSFCIQQVLVQGYEEEAALLAYVATVLAEAGLLITYNGKSYDAPMLLDRARYWTVPLEVPGDHLDLLHTARRRFWRAPHDCRLETLERLVCGRRRSGDVPGFDVPGRFHHYLQCQDPSVLVPVLHHNALDLLTLVELLGRLLPHPPGERLVADADAYAGPEWLG